MYGGYFNSKEEAEKYKSEHELYVMAAEYITCKKQWALVFPVHAVSDSGTVELLGYLKRFMMQSEWDDEHVANQVRAIFTTLCLTRGIVADTSICDTILNELYCLPPLQSADITYENFENFMLQLIV